MNILQLIFLVPFFVVAGGCTPLTEVRKVHENVKLAVQSDEVLLAHCASGQSGSSSMDKLANSVEDYGDHLIGFVEYSDQGWEYTNQEKSQRDVLLARLRSDLADPNFQSTKFLNIIFVHGWHHNAGDSDCNVNEFRAMLHRVSRDINDAATRAGAKYNFRVNGIYVGWRGESTSVVGARQLTIFTRRTAAEHVAKGAVRELFADLRKLEIEDQPKKNRIRTIAVGHSFGGLIVFHSLAQSLINELTFNRQNPEIHGGKVTACNRMANAPKAWPDLTVLLNPAFEASRFEAIYSAAQPISGCPHSVDRPKLIVVTAENDWATGAVFPFFRSIITIFEKYDATTNKTKEAEELSNHHAIGFVDRYKTHRLKLIERGEDTCISQYLDPKANASNLDPHNPVWVVGVTPDIVNGHDGFLYPDIKNGKYNPFLLHWLINVYLDENNNQDTKNLFEQYRKYKCVDKATAAVNKE